MGSGKSYKCKNCGEEYQVMTGFGLGFPMFFRKTIKDIKAGRYGEEWKRLINSGEYIVPDAETYLFYCKQCGTWKTDADLSLYQPRDIEAIKKKKFGETTVEERGEIPYATTHDFKEEYNLVKKRIHYCPKCNEEMTRCDNWDEKEELLKALSCPKCSTKNEPLGRILWD